MVGMKEILFSIEKCEKGAVFCNYTKEAKMIVKIENTIILIPEDSFLIYEYEFEIDKLEIKFDMSTA